MSSCTIYKIFCPHLYLQNRRSTSTTMFTLSISLRLTSTGPRRLSNSSVMLFLPFLSQSRICLISLVPVCHCLGFWTWQLKTDGRVLQRLPRSSFKSFLVLAPWQTPSPGLTVQTNILGMPSPSRASKTRREVLTCGRLEGRRYRLGLSL